MFSQVCLQDRSTTTGFPPSVGIACRIYSFNEPVLLLNSTVPHNVVGRDGGGIFNQVKLRAVRTSITGNTEERTGGGIFKDDGNVTLRLGPLTSNVSNSCVSCS